MSHEEEAQNEETTKAVIHKEQSGPSHVTGGLSLSSQGGLYSVRENGSSWGGGGILKTVDVRVSAPEPARLSRISKTYVGHSQEV